MTKRDPTPGTDLFTPPHLRYVLELDSEKRLDYLTQGVWIEHDAAAEIIDHLHALHGGKLDDNPRCPRNALVVADAGVGKTTTVGEFSASYPQTRGVDDMLSAPVLWSRANTQASLDNYYLEVVKKYNAPTSSKKSRYGQFLSLIEKAKVKTLVVDELHEVQYAKPQKRDQFVHQVCKHLPDELGIHVVALGTLDAVALLAVDNQLYDRYDTLVLEPWLTVKPEQRKAFEEFLNSYEGFLPLKRPSGLSRNELLTAILSLTGGVNRRIARLLFESAQLAITSGTESITLETLNSVVNKKRYFEPGRDATGTRREHVEALEKRVKERYETSW